jgi:hypothetical protein
MAFLGGAWTSSSGSGGLRSKILGIFSDVFEVVGSAGGEADLGDWARANCEVEAIKIGISNSLENELMIDCIMVFVWQEQ